MIIVAVIIGIAVLADAEHHRRAKLASWWRLPTDGRNEVAADFAMLTATPVVQACGILTAPPCSAEDSDVPSEPA